MSASNNLRLPELKSFFCCCSLEIGTCVIAYIHLILFAIGTLFVFVVHVVFHDHYSYNDSDFKIVFYRDDLFFTVSAYYVIFSTCALLGVHMKSRILLVPFLCLKGVAIFRCTIDLSCLVLVRIIGEKEQYIFTILTVLWVEIYMFTVIHSHHKQLRPKETKEEEVSNEINTNANAIEPNHNKCVKEMLSTDRWHAQAPTDWEYNECLKTIKVVDKSDVIEKELYYEDFEKMKRSVLQYKAPPNYCQSEKSQEEKVNTNDQQEGDNKVGLFDHLDKLKIEATKYKAQPSNSDPIKILQDKEVLDEPANPEDQLDN